MIAKAVVTKFIQGAGLGNQMFEWAGGLAIARRLGIGHHWIWEPDRHREFGLGIFGIGANPPPEHELIMRQLRERDPSWWENALERVRTSKHPYPAIMCPFQQEGCFAGVADEVRKAFHLEPLRPRVPAGRVPVAVHVRRGDYIGHPRLNVTNERYFRNAMAKMRELLPNAHFMVVSEDADWCRQHLAGNHVTVLPEGDEKRDLRVMIGCEAHIISNSTFGWWGAWLGEKGPVIAPSLWHHAAGCYGDWHPVPDRWVKVGGVRPDNDPPLLPVTSFRRLPDPGIPRAIVYPWHSGMARWEELRFSLRSIHRFFEDKECPIFILGNDRPGWLGYQKGRVTYRNVWAYQDALIDGVQAADKVLWMNDDIFLLKPTTWAECAVPRFIGNLSDGFLVEADESANAWRAGVLALFRKLEGWGIHSKRMFSTHTPYVWEREKSIAVMEKFGGVWNKFAFENAYFHHYPEGARHLGGDFTQKAPVGGSRFLNVTNGLLSAEVKDFLKALLPDPAPWEAPGIPVEG